MSRGGLRTGVAKYAIVSDFLVTLTLCPNLDLKVVFCNVTCLHGFDGGSKSPLFFFSLGNIEQHKNAGHSLGIKHQNYAKFYT